MVARVAVHAAVCVAPVVVEAGVVRVVAARAEPVVAARAEPVVAEVAPCARARSDT
jgi:hypothetical protein